MLFPLGDDNRSRTITPYVTWFLIAANVLVFIYQLMNESFTYGYSVVPYEITHGTDLIGPGVFNRAVEMVKPPQSPGPSPIYLTFLS